MAYNPRPLLVTIQDSKYFSLDVELELKSTPTLLCRSCRTEQSSPRGISKNAENIAKNLQASIQFTKKPLWLQVINAYWKLLILACLYCSIGGRNLCPHPPRIQNDLSLFCPNSATLSWCGRTSENTEMPYKKFSLSLFEMRIYCMGSNGPWGLLTHNPTLKMILQLFSQKYRHCFQIGTSTSHRTNCNPW